MQRQHREVFEKIFTTKHVDKYNITSILNRP